MVESIVRRRLAFLARRADKLLPAAIRGWPGWSALCAVALVVGLSLTGCGDFFAKTTTTTTTTTTTSTTNDYLYVANSNTSLDTVAGFSLSSGTLSATSNSPYQLGVLPNTLAITPTNTLLFVGSELGGIYGYLIGSDGGLTSNNVSPLAVSPAAMAVDSTGSWLLVLENGATNPVLQAYPIDTTTGAFSNVASSVTLDAGSAESLVLVPNSTLIYASLGSSTEGGGGGVDALTFDSSTGTLTKLSIILEPRGSAYSDHGLATDPAGKYLFVAETGTNGIRSFTIGSDGTLSELSGSPTAAGLGIGSLVVDSGGSFLYAANQADSTISAFTVASTGALTAIAGSPFATGSTPYAMAEDNSKGYLAVACTGGTPDLQLFAINATTGVLSSAIQESTGSVSPAGAIAIAASH